MPESTDRPELSQDALVEALVPDPDHLAEVIMLHGYLGKSAVEGSWRLYLTPALDEYVEIPEDKILHHRRLAEDRGTMVWVPRGLALQHKQIRSEEVQAEFLAGPIASQYLRPDDSQSPEDLLPLVDGVAGHQYGPLGMGEKLPNHDAGVASGDTAASPARGNQIQDVLPASGRRARSRKSSSRRSPIGPP